MIAISIVIIEWTKRQKQIAKQQDFAMAVALTRTAKDAASDVMVSLDTAFDRPTPFTKRGITIIPAKKGEPVAYVLAKDIQADYLAIQEVGGVRTPKPGAPVLAPVQIGVNVYGNIPKGKIRREIAKPAVFVSGQDESRTRHLPPGIYQRFKPTRRHAARPPKLLVALRKRAGYRPRLGMHKTVNKTVLRTFPGHYIEALRKALESAR